MARPDTEGPDRGALIRDTFDLVLAYPQWQGSGRPENLERGARAAASVCAKYGSLETVPSAGAGESLEGVNRATAILQQFMAAQAILARRRPDRVLTAGGDCACDIAVIDYLRQRHAELTVIWFDAHLDANTPVTSPSGNLHGMPVASILGAAPRFLRDLMGPRVDPERFRYVSAAVGDDGDWDLQRRHSLTWLDPAELPEGPIHIHFDLDCLDPAEFPHLAYTDGSLRTADAIKLVGRLAAAGHLVGLTVTEFAPADEAAAIEGAVFIRDLCDAAII